VVLCSLAAPLAGAAAPAWHELAVPGGHVALARAAELDPNLEPWRAVAEVARLLHATPEGGALAAKVLAHLDAAGADPAQDESAPLPLAADVWERVVFGRPVPPRQLLAAILADRRAALLYVGLMSLDDPTLAFLSDEPRTLALVMHRHARAFALFSGALRVGGGAVQVPGGNGDVALWEAVVGESVTRPARFLQELLRREGGSLLYLYDTVSRLPEPARRFALGAVGGDLVAREALLRGLAAAFRRGDSFWDEGRAHMTRPAVDPARVLLELPVSRDGALAPPWRREFWEAVLDETRAASASTGEPEPVDAVFLVDRIANEDAAAAPQRLALLHFAHRSFADADESEQMLEALRGFARAPALMLSLERIGLRDPDVHAAAAKRARQLVAPPAGQPSAVALAQFQAALAFVDRARFTRALAEHPAQQLARSLVALEPVAGPRYGARLAAWLEGELLPALGAEDGDSAEQVLAAALAGASAARARLTWWSGQRLRVDVAAAERARFDAVRRTLGGNSLDRVLDYMRSAAALAAAPAAPETWRAHAWVLEEAALELGPGGLASAGSADAGALAAALWRELEASPRAPGAAAAFAQQALALGEALLAETLVVLTYASHVGPADARRLAGHVARRHDFGLEARRAEQRERAAWALPLVAEGKPWRLRGSLLALETALAPLALRRANDALPTPAPALSDADRRGFAQLATLVNPSVLTDADRDSVAAALARGRARAGDIASDPARSEAIADEVCLGPYRRRMLAWLARREPAALDGFFSLAELYALGDSGADVHAWGVPDVPRAGLLPRLPPLRPPEDFVGVRGRLAARVPDLGLRVAAALARHRLPAELAPALLSFAVQDLLDEATPMAGDDAEALARYARALPDERIGGYLAALIDSGFLRVELEDLAAGGSR
jgi:hypothetical protein